MRIGWVSKDSSVLGVEYVRLCRSMFLWQAYSDAACNRRQSHLACACRGWTAFLHCHALSLKSIPGSGCRPAYHCLSRSNEGVTTSNVTRLFNWNEESTPPLWHMSVCGHKWNNVLVCTKERSCMTSLQKRPQAAYARDPQ
jgi:hypothetical protein